MNFANIGYSMSAMRREIRRKVGQVGIRGAFMSALRKIFRLRKNNSASAQAIHPFDLKYGTDTSGIIESGALDIPEEAALHAVRYQTAIVEVFNKILSTLPLEDHNYVFVDLGSGKGRSLLLASQYPFKEIIGVELSPALHMTACENIRIYKDPAQRCHLIRSICDDATDFALPDEYLVFYLFNPFDDKVMRRVVSNIEQSFRCKPRMMYIAYLKPVCRKLWDQATFLRVFKETESFVIYETMMPALIVTDGKVSPALDS